VDIPGATSATLNLTAVTLSQAGAYRAVVSNSAGSATSAAATLTVSASPVGPLITTQPESQAVLEGAVVTFTVAATGTGPLGYQWQKNGVAIPGATSDSLVLNGATLDDAGSYRVVVSQGGASAASVIAILTVNSAPVLPTITTSPSSQIVAPGVSVTLSVTVSSPTPLSYQWQKDGEVLPGATSADLRLTGVTTSQAGSYRVLVSNAAGSALSASAALTVISAENPAPTVRLAVVEGNVRLTIKGRAGSGYRIEYNSSLDPNGWKPLQELVLPTSQYVLVTTIPGHADARFYRALPR
jgi:hypothetical protein